MKIYLLAGVTVLLLAVASAFIYVKYCPLATKSYTTANNVLRWVRDPVLGTYYYGWYATDGGVFNCVETAPKNRRMGNAQPANVPVHMWQRVN